MVVSDSHQHQSLKILHYTIPRYTDNTAVST